MSFCSRSSCGRPQIKAEKERVKVLKVVGEAIGQLVVQNTISINAVKIISIDAELREVVDHVFCGKVVKQGIIHKQVIYVDPHGILRDLSENIPFMLAVDIPGVEKTPYTDVQNHVLDIDTDYILEPTTEHCPGRLDQKIVAHVKVIVSEWTVMDIITKVDLFPKVNSLQRSDCSKKNSCCEGSVFVSQKKDHSIPNLTRVIY